MMRLAACLTACAAAGSGALVAPLAPIATMRAARGGPSMSLGPFRGGLIAIDYDEDALERAVQAEQQSAAEKAAEQPVRMSDKAERLKSEGVAAIAQREARQAMYAGRARLAAASIPEPKEPIVPAESLVVGVAELLAAVLVAVTSAVRSLLRAGRGAAAAATSAATSAARRARALALVPVRVLGPYWPRGDVLQRPQRWRKDPARWRRA